MNKIKIGMYVRTESGIIAKIENKIRDCIYETDVMVLFFNNFELKDKDIKKASFDIIDLIEVGDYVNGNIVLYKDTGIAHNQNLIVCIGRDEERHIYDENCIKSIVTKEQFESMSYRIGE